MSILSLIKGHHGASGFGYASTAEDVTHGIDLTNKVVLITGVNSGLGQETARVLASRGAHIIALARTIEKSKKVVEQYPNASAFACDLSEPNSVQRCVDSIKNAEKEIDILICNAGIMALPKLQQKHGCEMQFLTNHIGHFILVTGLLESLSSAARVVMLSSAAHKFASKGLELANISGEKNYSRWRMYGRSKLANLLFALELSKRFEGSERTANAVHPGVIRTNLGRHMGGLMSRGQAMTDFMYAKSIQQGAATTCFVGTHPSLSLVSGKYFADSNTKETSRYGADANQANALWDISEKIVFDSLSI